MKYPHSPLSGMRLGLRASIVAIALLAPLASAGTRTVEGEGVLCILIDAGAIVVECDVKTEELPDINAPEAKVQTAEVKRVTLTVTWQSVSEATREMNIFLAGNPRCSGPSCDLAEVWGESPLSVSLEGRGASHTEVQAWINHDPSCTWGGFNALVPQDCDEPAGVLIRQPYHYTWTIEE